MPFSVRLPLSSLLPAIFLFLTNSGIAGNDFESFGNCLFNCLISAVNSPSGMQGIELLNRLCAASDRAFRIILISCSFAPLLIAELCSIKVFSSLAICAALAGSNLKNRISSNALRPRIVCLSGSLNSTPDLGARYCKYPFKKLSKISWCPSGIRKS